jgi:transketolase
MKNYEKIALDSRIKVLNLVYKAQTSHIGSLFSCADIMAVVFEKIDLSVDKFVLSAGWKAALLYYHLWRKGRITGEELNSYCQEGSKFIGLAEPIHPDIQIAGGSMGLGLPGAVGLALAKKIKGEPGMVYCLMSDGEFAIGTTYESLLIANHHKLDNLVVIVDDNGLQAMGKTDDILSTSQIDLDETIDGHNYEELEMALSHWTHGETLVIRAKTIKGKGVSFMENNNLYHYKQLSETEYAQALEELHG